MLVKNALAMLENEIENLRWNMHFFLPDQHFDTCSNVRCEVSFKIRAVGLHTP